VNLPHSKSNGDPSDGQNRGKTNPSTWEELESGPDGIGKQDQDLVCDRIWVLGVLVLVPIGSRNQISELLIEKCIIGLYLLYTSQNLLGTIFRVTFAVLYRRIWSIAGNYSILCCDINIFLDVCFCTSCGVRVIYTSILICSETSKPTAFDFYDGVFVFWTKRFFFVQVFCFISLFNTAVSYSTTWLDFVLV
jgi:hypothetical protein